MPMAFAVAAAKGAIRLKEVSAISLISASSARLAPHNINDLPDQGTGFCNIAIRFTSDYDGELVMGFDVMRKY